MINGEGMTNGIAVHNRECSRDGCRLSHCSSSENEHRNEIKTGFAKTYFETYRSYPKSDGKDCHDLIQMDNPKDSDPHFDRVIVKPKRSRTILSEDQVKEIYSFKKFNSTASASKRISSPTLAKKYGVGEKTIRDIWNGRTWFRKTFHRGQQSDHLDATKVGKAGQHSQSAKLSSKSNASTSNSIGSTSPPSLPTLELSRTNHLHDRDRHQCAGKPFQPQLSFLSKELSDIDWVLMSWAECHNSSSENAPHLDSKNPLNLSDPFHEDWKLWSGGQ